MARRKLLGQGGLPFSPELCQQKRNFMRTALGVGRGAKIVKHEAILISEEGRGCLGSPSQVSRTL